MADVRFGPFASECERLLSIAESRRYLTRPTHTRRWIFLKADIRVNDSFPVGGDSPGRYPWPRTGFAQKIPVASTLKTAPDCRSPFCLAAISGEWFRPCTRLPNS